LAGETEVLGENLEALSGVTTSITVLWNVRTGTEIEFSYIPEHSEEAGSPVSQRR
jgi:hypothetical protein